MNLAERIQTIIDETGADQVQLGAAAGVTKGTVNQWLSSDIKSIKLEYAVGIQQRYGYSAIWIVLGTEPKMVAPSRGTEALSVTSEAIRASSSSRFGDDTNWSELERLLDSDGLPVYFPTLDPDAYAMRCDGDSLRPRVQAGEFIVVEPGRPVEPGDDVLLRHRDGLVMLKRYLYQRDGRTYVISVNETRPPFGILDDDIEKMEFVRAICRPSMQDPK